MTQLFLKDYYSFCLLTKKKKQLIQAVDENNLDNFTNAVKEYDNMSRLDNWCTTLLLRVKKAINE